jgi:hypothetical protein
VVGPGVRSLAAAKLLAVSVIALPGSGSTTDYVLSTTQESVYCKAKTVAEANRYFGASTITLTLQFGTVAQPADPATWDPPTWETYTGSTTCPPSPTVTTPVDPDTRFVRVVAADTYCSIYALVGGGSDLTASASARARLTGTAITKNAGPTWPMVRHYDPNDFVNDCVTGNTCSDATKAAPKTFWSSNDNWTVYGNFKGATRKAVAGHRAATAFSALGVRDDGTETRRMDTWHAGELERAGYRVRVDIIAGDEPACVAFIEEWPSFALIGSSVLDVSVAARHGDDGLVEHAARGRSDRPATAASEGPPAAPVDVQHWTGRGMGSGAPRRTGS